jgi:hypothetical protein
MEEPVGADQRSAAAEPAWKRPFNACRWLSEIRTSSERPKRRIARSTCGALWSKRACQRLCSQVLRCKVARTLTGESLRDFGCRLAESGLLQWFCKLEQLDAAVRIPGKGALQRCSQWLPEAEMQTVIGTLLAAASDGRGAPTGWLGCAVADLFHLQSKRVLRCYHLRPRIVGQHAKLGCKDKWYLLNDSGEGQTEMGRKRASAALKHC